MSSSAGESGRGHDGGRADVSVTPGAEVKAQSRPSMNAFPIAEGDRRSSTCDDVTWRSMSKDLAWTANSEFVPAILTPTRESAVFSPVRDSTGDVRLSQSSLSRRLSRELEVFTSCVSADAFRTSLSLTTQTLALSIVSIAFLPLMILWILHTDDVDSWRVDASAKESLVMHSAAFMPNKAPMLTLAESSFVRVIGVTWLPVLMAFTMRLSGKRQYIVPSVFLATALMYTFLLHGPWRLNVGGWMLTQVYYLASLTFFKILLPCDSSVWLLMLCMILVLGLSQVGVQVMILLISVNENLVIVASAVLLPVFRECMLMPLRFVVHIFMTDKKVAGTGVRVPHSLCLILVLYPMTGVSIFGRLMTQSLTSPGLLFVSVAGQSIIEAAFRLTMFQRDDFIWKTFKRVSRVHSLRSLKMKRSASFKSSFVFRSRAQETIEFTSLFVICEMMSEYLAILSTIFFLPMCWSIRYMLSFGEYVNEDYIYDDFDVTWVLLSTAFMVAAEVLVDSICGMYEIAIMQMPLQEAWNNMKPIGRFLLFGVPLVLGASATMNAVFNTSNFHWRSCTTANVCYCHEDDANIIVKDYCRLLYPTTDGMPAGVQTYVIRGYGADAGEAWPFHMIDEAWVRPHSPDLSFAGYFIDFQVEAYSDLDINTTISRAHEVADSAGRSHGYHFSADKPGLAIFVLQEGPSPRIVHVHGALCQESDHGDGRRSSKLEHIPPVVILQAPTPDLFVQAAGSLVPAGARSVDPCGVW